MSETLTSAQIKQRRKELELREKELELVKLGHEVQQAEAEAKKAADDAVIHRYLREAEDRDERTRKATDATKFDYHFKANVDNGSVAGFIGWLTRRRLTDPGQPVTLTIYSPGGSVFAGFAMMDAMREARDAGTEITAKITGYGASMAGIVAQAATTRLIGRDSYLMLHEVSQGMLGGYKLSELEDETEFLKRLSRHCDRYYAARSGGKWTVEAIEAKIKKFEWWLNADEALENGFVDGIF